MASNPNRRDVIEMNGQKQFICRSKDEQIFLVLLFLYLTNGRIKMQAR